MNTPRIRFRIDFGDSSFVGPGKIDLLEAIQRCGSLSQAAREIGMSYRRAWLLLEAVNGSFRERAAIASTGGRGGGGVQLTGFGEQLVATYRQLQRDIAALAAGRLREITAQTLASTPKSPVPRRPVTRAQTAPKRGSQRTRKLARRAVH